MPSRIQPISLFTFTVSNGANLSDVIHLQGLQPTRIFIPATVQGTYLIFRAGETDSSLVNCYDMSGALVVAAMSASRAIEVDPIFFRSASYFQLKTCSNNTGTGQNQSQDTSFLVVAV